MDMTEAEKLMYRVMDAVYRSSIPVSFKGSMVLRACLMEAGYIEDTRHTADIDANWVSDIPPSAEQMTRSLRDAVHNCGIDLDIDLYRMFGEGRSAGFEIKDGTTGEILFTMDMDVNRPVPATRIYEIDEICFRGAAPVQMIADKISVVSCDKVFRRIKDVVDLYYLSKVIAFDCNAVMNTLNVSGRTLGDFTGFLYRYEELHHAYDRFRFTGDVSKPGFETVYNTVKEYIIDVIPISPQGNNI